MSSFGNRGTEQLLVTTSGSATGIGHTPPGDELTILASLVGTGAVTCTVVIEVTNDVSVTTSWLTMGTITLSGTTTAQDGFATQTKWAAIRARTSAISGTGATLTVTMGY